MSKTSAIRVSVTRALSESEKEWVRDLIRVDTGTVAFTNWNGFTYRWTKYPFHIRLSRRGKFWLHSNVVEARRLYWMFVKNFLNNNFVNIHPTAVRTFSSIAANKDQGEIIEDIFEEEAIRRGWKAPPVVDPYYCAACGGPCRDEENDAEEEDWEVVGLVDV